MIEIGRSNASEFNEVIDFIDFVFSKSSCPHDFPTMLPHLYRPTDQSMNNLLCLRENGVIKASLLCMPRTLVLGDHQLKVYGIGSVATHPRSVGKGFMSTLMNYTVEEMKKEGVHLSHLAGKRSRYNHFGYEITGNIYSSALPLDALKTAYPFSLTNQYSFKALAYEDKQLVERCKAIYDKKFVHYEYDYDQFYLRMYTKSGSTPYAVFFGEQLLGFLAMGMPQDMRSVNEVCLADETLLSPVLFAFMAANNTGLHMHFSHAQIPFLRPFLDISEELIRTGNNMWNILRFREVLLAFMNHKAQYTALVPGRLVFNIETMGTFAVCFDNDGTVQVTNTTDKADFVFSPRSAARAFFGPSPEVIYGLDHSKEKNALIKSWFPLPLASFLTESV